MTIDFKSIFYIANSVCAFQRTLRLAMSSENRLPRQQRPTVMFGQNIDVGGHFRTLDSLLDGTRKDVRLREDQLLSSSILS